MKKTKIMIYLLAAFLLLGGCTKNSGKQGEGSSSESETSVSKEESTTSSEEPDTKEENDEKNTRETGENTPPEEKQSPSLVFQNVEDVKKFMVGEWVYRHTPSGTDMAWLTVSEDGTYYLKILNPKNEREYLSEGKMEVVDYTFDENGVPNVLSFQTTKFNYPYIEGEGGYSYDGDFVLSYKTLAEEEYIIELFQLNNGETPLFDIFDSPDFVFRQSVIFRATVPVLKNADFYAICTKKDPERKRIWLDEVEFDKSKKAAIYGKTLEATAYEISGTIPDLFGKTTEYLCDLVHVVTDADGKVVSYETIDFTNDPWNEPEEGE